MLDAQQQEALRQRLIAAMASDQSGKCTLAGNSGTSTPGSRPLANQKQMEDAKILALVDHCDPGHRSFLTYMYIDPSLDLLLENAERILRLSDAKNNQLKAKSVERIKLICRIGLLAYRDKIISQASIPKHRHLAGVIGVSLDTWQRRWASHWSRCLITIEQLDQIALTNLDELYYKGPNESI